MKLHTLDSTNTHGREAPFVLEPAERPLDGGASPVEPLPAQRLAGDQRVQTVGLDPDRRGLALAGRTTPLAGVALAVSADASGGRLQRAKSMEAS